MRRPRGGLGNILWLTAVRKGFFGGQRLWFTIFVTAGAVKVFRRFSGSTPDIVYNEPLGPGEALLITHHADVLHGDKPR